MGAVRNFLEWLLKLFDNAPRKTPAEQAQDEAQVNAYTDITEFNITSVIANKFANVVVGDSTITVTGNSPRAEFMRRSLNRVFDKLRLIAARAAGIGGVVLKPYVVGNELYAEIHDQSEFFKVDQQGEVVRSAQIISDIQMVDDIEYIRVTQETLEDDGSYVILNKAVTEGKEVTLETVEDWADIPPVQTITGVEQMLFAFIKCPTDNKTAIDNFRGVPLTYGQGQLIEMIRNLLIEIPEEYRLKRAFVGAADTLFDGQNRLPDNGLYKRFTADGAPGDKPFWELYSPEIRNSSYFAGLDYLFGLMEKAIGVNKGVLTDLDTADATATAIKRSTYDTFNLASEMRRNIEVGIRQLAYAFDVYATVGNLAPQGDFDLEFDWSYTLLEDSQETFDQLRQTVSDGGLGIEHLTAYVLGISPEKALKKLPDLTEPPPKAVETPAFGA